MPVVNMEVRKPLMPLGVDHIAESDFVFNKPIVRKPLMPLGVDHNDHCFACGVHKSRAKTFDAIRR